MNTYEDKKAAYEEAVKAFIDRDLYPAIYEALNVVFPSLGWKRKGAKWVASKDVNGNETGREDALYIVPSHGRAIRIAGNGSRGGVDARGEEVISLYQRLNGVKYRNEAAEAIAAVLGLKGFPVFTDFVPAADIARKASADRERDAREKAARVFTANLREGTTPEAEEARAYIRTRFTEDEIALAYGYNSLGLADAETLARLEAEAPGWHGGEPLQKQIGTTNLLAIISPDKDDPAAFFTFRALPSMEKDARNKYERPVGAKVPTLCGLPYGTKSVVVVEGEIDRLKASLALDAANRQRRQEGKEPLAPIVVVSAGTNTIGTEKAEEAVRRGVKTFYLIPDRDAAGEKGLRNTLKNLEAAGAEAAYVVTLAAGKDTAEYIKAEGLVGWYKAVTAEAISAPAYLAKAYVREYAERFPDGEGKARRDELLRNLEALVSSPLATSQTPRDIYDAIKNAQASADAPAFLTDVIAEDFLAYLREKRARMEKAKAEATLKADIEAAQKRAADGDLEGATALLTESLTKNNQAKPADYSAAFATPSSVAEIEAGLRDVLPGVSTGLYMLTAEDEVKEVTLKEGVSLLVGARKHGKTTALCNIVLNAAEANVAAYKEDPLSDLKKVYLFTYEVRPNRITRDLLAIYLRKHAPTNAEKALDYREIVANYYDRGTLPADKIAAGRFKEAKDRFFKDVIQTGALSVVDLGRKDVEAVVDALTSLIKAGERIGLIGLDYIQKLTTEAKAKATRPEALKYIGEVLTDFGVENKIPILCAAQFNRISNLLQVDTTNIGEAGDLERNAVDVLALFNLKELRPLTGSRAESTQAYGLHVRTLTKFGIPEEGFTEDVPTGEVYKAGDLKGQPITGKNLKPLPGKMYLALLASRYGDFPAEIITDFEGGSGYLDIANTTYYAGDAKKRADFWREKKEAARMAYPATPVASAPEEPKKGAEGCTELFPDSTEDVPF